MSTEPGDRLFSSLRQRVAGAGDYGWQSGPPTSRFNPRPIPVGGAPAAPASPVAIKVPPGRTEDGDRPPAYPVVPAPHAAVPSQPQYVKPTVKEIFIDLGLRMLEVAIGAAAAEIAYYFTRRRFLPKGYHS